MTAVTVVTKRIQACLNRMGEEEAALLDEAVLKLKAGTSTSCSYM